MLGPFKKWFRRVVEKADPILKAKREKRDLGFPSHALFCNGTFQVMPNDIGKVP